MFGLRNYKIIRHSLYCSYIESVTPNKLNTRLKSSFRDQGYLYQQATQTTGIVLFIPLTK